MMTMPRCAALALSLCAFLAGCRSEPPADLILRGGNIVTVDSAVPRAQALAVREDRIVAVGTDQEVERLRGSQTRVIDLAEKTAVPGLIDAHLHFPGIGKLLSTVFLDTTKSPAEAIAIVAREVKKAGPGEWIVGQGWHTVEWGQGYPDNRALSQASPDNPVFLVGMATHAAWANDRALQIAGVTAATPDPPGGRILKDSKTGRPTGILLETAQALVSRHIPSETREARKSTMRLSGETLASLGLTGAHDAGASPDDVELYQELLAEGALPIRLDVMLRVPGRGPELDAILSQPPRIGLGDNRLSVRTIKVFADGALGARGAALLAPYSDSPGESGLLQNSEDDLAALVRQSMEAGYQVAIHAIGDRGNRIALDAIERAMQELPGRDARHRVEHAQIVALEDIPRFARLGVLPSMQPIHAPTDMGFAEARVGPERIKGGYAWRSLLDSGARLVASSDTPAFPIEYTNPLWGIHAAVRRQDQHGRPPGGWYPEQRVSRLDALRMYTINAAYASFADDVRGSISPGKLADLTVLSKDILSIPEAEILQTQVVMTIVGGRIVYERKEPVR